MATYSPQSLGISAPNGGFQNGGWYQGRQYWDGNLGDPGVIINPNQSGAGQRVSNEVAMQSNPGNVSYIDNQIKASQIQAPNSLSLPSTSASTQSVLGLNAEVEAARKALNTTLAQQKAEADKKYADLQAKEQTTLSKIGDLTSPFRADLEKAERDRLYINQNFEANQTLINELDTLLTQGNEAIKQQQSVTGLAAVRNPRIQKTIDDVNARAGVIQAVISARNGQIAQAETLIDRSVSAIASDRQDQISYYNTILELNRRDMVTLDEASKKIAEEQLNLKKGDLEQAQTTANYVKQLLVNPTTAALMGQAGVKLTDSIDQINYKLTQTQQLNEVTDMNNEMAKSGYSAIFDPKGYPADQIVTISDKNGNKYYYKKLSSGSGSGFDASNFMKTLASSGFTVNGMDVSKTPAVNADSIWDEVLNPSVSYVMMGGKPSFIPTSGIGTAWTDPSGKTWVYGTSGWSEGGNKNPSSNNADFSFTTRDNYNTPKFSLPKGDSNVNLGNTSLSQASRSN